MFLCLLMVQNVGGSRGAIDDVVGSAARLLGLVMVVVEGAKRGCQAKVRAVRETMPGL